MSDLSGKGTLRGSLGAGGGSSPRDVYWDDILNKPEFAAVATSGSYNDLTDKPTVMLGATEQSNGAAGFTPQPMAGDQNKFLNGAGEWATPQSSGTNYSLDEVIVGTWVDGKPIYRKGITLNSLTYGTSWISVPHNVSNMGKLIKLYGCLYNTNDHRMFTIPISRASSDDGIIIGCDTTNLYYINDWLQGTTSVYIFIEYTKTID